MLGVIVASNASTQTAHVGGVLLVPPALSLRLHHSLDIYRVYMQWRINHDANDAMAWGPPLKGAPRAAV